MFFYWRSRLVFAVQCLCSVNIRRTDATAGEKQDLKEVIIFVFILFLSICFEFQNSQILTAFVSFLLFTLLDNINMFRFIITSTILKAFLTIFLMYQL